MARYYGVHFELIPTLGYDLLQMRDRTAHAMTLRRLAKGLNH